jgi:hypothetical protein
MLSANKLTHRVDTHCFLPCRVGHPAKPRRHTGGAADLRPAVICCWAHCIGAAAELHISGCANLCTTNCNSGMPHTYISWPLPKPFSFSCDVSIKFHDLDRLL